MLDLISVLSKTKKTVNNDDLNIINTWTEYDDKRENMKYLMYELQVEEAPGKFVKFFKAVKIVRIVRLPKSAKQSEAFMDMHTGVLRGVWERNIKLLTIIANIIEPDPVGLLFCYGVQGVATTEEDAKKIADNDFYALTAALQGTYRVLEFHLLKYKELEWLKEKMFTMKNITVVRGLPKPKQGGVDAGNTGIGGKNVNPDSQDTSEEFIAGMSSHEYVVEVLTTPVKAEHLDKWLTQTAKEMTMWNKQLQGSTNIGFGISIPMMYMANLGASEGWSHAYSDASTDSVTHGSSFSTSFSNSIGENLSHSVGETLGRSLGNSYTESYGQSHGINVGQNMGQNVGISHGANVGSSLGDSWGHSTGESTGMNIGHNVGSSEGSSISHSISDGTNESHSTSHSVSTGVTETNGTTHSTSHSVSDGTSHTVSNGTSSSSSRGWSSSSGGSSSTTNGTSNSASTGSNSSTSSSNGTNSSISVGGSHTEGTSDSVGGSVGSSVGGNIGGSHIGVNGSVNSSVNYSHGHNSSDTISVTGSAGSSHTDTTSNGTSNSLSTGNNHSTSSGSSWSSGSSGSTTSGSSHSVSDGTSHTVTNGYSDSTSHSVSNSKTIGDTTGYSTGVSHSVSDSTGQNWSNSQGDSWGSSYSANESANVGSSSGTSAGENWGNSAGTSWGDSSGENWGVNQSQSYGATQTDSYSASSSVSAGKSWSQSQGASSGESWGSSSGTSKGVSMGTTGAISSGTAATMGLGPSASFSKSYNWNDQEVQNIITLLNFQNERLMKALRGNGAFYTDMYIATEDEKGLSAASALAKSAWHDENAYICPLQVLDLSPEEQAHLLYHFGAFSPDNSKINIENRMTSYKYSTILLPDEITAFTHLPRISEGGIYADVEDIPKFAVPSQLQGDIYMGKVVSAERWTPESGNETPFDYRFDESELMHGIFTGESRSGKTVAAMRFASELVKVRRKKTGKRLRMVVMDPKQDWRGLAKMVEPERFHFYSLGNLEFQPINLNICKVPHNVAPQTWIDGLIEIYCRAYGLLERGKALLGETLYELYQEAGVFEDSPNWREFVPERSAKVSMCEAYKRLVQHKVNLEDPAKSKTGRAGNEARDSYERLIDRMRIFGREFSLESRLFGRTDGIGVDELIGKDDVVVLESYGLESTFKNFIFGCITSGFFKYAQGHEGGFLADDQYETVMVIEEANEILTGSDTGARAASGMQLGGQSEFEKILDQAAGLGLFIISITQKIADMPSSVIANSGLLFAGKISRQEDTLVVIRKIGREERLDNRDILKWFPRSPIGWFVCRSSRNFNFLQTEPVLVHIDPISVPKPTNEELEAILTKKKAITLLNEDNTKEEEISEVDRIIGKLSNN